MTYVPAIPTLYKNVQFRSRLEARWAAFFDLLGWKWAYEPIDLAGYIPDFIVTSYREQTLVEVKPFTSLDEDVTEAKVKVYASGWQGVTAIVGACLHPYEGRSRNGVHASDSIRVGHWGNGTNWYGCDVNSDEFTHNDHETATIVDDTDEQQILKLWAEAGNEVQWRKPQISPPKPDATFSASMAALATQARTAAEASFGTLTNVDLDAALKSAQKRLAARKDPEALRDACYIGQVNKGEPLSGDPEDRQVTLAYATLAVVRAAPKDTTTEQIRRKLLASAGVLAVDLPKIIEAAQRAAVGLPSLFSRSTQPAPVTTTPQSLDEFVLEGFGAQLMYDTFSGRKVLARDGVRLVLEDHHVDSLFLDVERKFHGSSEFNGRSTRGEFHDYISRTARQHTFHPVRDYLDALPVWDGVPRVEAWLADFVGAPDCAYVRAVSRIVLVAAVRRVRQPGCKFDNILILEDARPGASGTTAVLRALAVNEDWFTDDFELDDDDKKVIEQTSGRWMVEAVKLSGMSTGDHTTFKKALSKTCDRAHMSYDRWPAEVPRQFIVIGTADDCVYSGDRQYWPVPVVELDAVGLIAMRDQLWAEASHLERANPEESYIRLDPELYDAVFAKLDNRREPDAFEIVLNDALDGMNGYIRIQDVWRLLGFHEERLPQKGDQARISGALKAIGFSSVCARSVNGTRGTYYVRGEGVERDRVLTVSGVAGGMLRVKSAGVAPGPIQPD